MQAWLSQNIGTCIVLAVLIAVVAVVIAFMRKNRKKGKSCCGGACGQCRMEGKCGPKT